MDPARWQRLEHLCFAALERAPAERAELLDASCLDDAALRRDAEELLLQLERDPAFLETPVAVLAATPGIDEPSAAIPESIGPYRLIRRIGRGGMGEVFLAVRETADIRRQVALKVIRRGMDTDDVLRRFRLERRILAALDHPNIAQLIDAEMTPDGRPYFVMEYVDGQPLTEYCTRMSLSIPRRLALFRIVCGAVQHAHQNLIVHRDLKPTNILVTEAGVPKLLDFGIGKVLAPTDAFGPSVETRTNVRLLTPEYAAPEQISGGPVTTATDVHGLGLLLFQLVTGRHPYLTGNETGAEIERLVVEAPAARLGTGDDLDTIVRKALHKEPDRRYPSAAALADDIQRHLDGRPVSARPDTLRYRVRKFVGRNRALVTAAVVAFGALLTTTAVTLVQSRRVRLEAARVTRERDKAIEVRGFLMEMFGATGADQAVGDTVTARNLLDLQAARVVAAYPGRPDLEAEMTEVLADGYDRLGLYGAALPLARRALELKEASAGPDHPDAASALNLVGWITHEVGRSADAVPLLERAVSTRRAAGPDARSELSRSLNDLGVVYNALGRHPDAQRVLTEALAIRRASVGDDHRAVGITANNLAAAHYFQRQVDSAIAVQALALRALQRSVGPDHQRTVVALGNLAAFKSAKGDWTAAESDYRELLLRQTAIHGREHPVIARVALSLAIVLSERGIRDRDDPALTEAERLFRDALAAFETRLGPGHPQVGSTLDRLTRVMIARGAAASAVPLQERAVTILSRASGDTSRAVAAAKGRLALARLESARWHLDAGRRRPADSLLTLVRARLVDSVPGADRIRGLLDSLAARR